MRWAGSLGRGLGGARLGQATPLPPAPVGLQDVNDAYVQQQALPTPVHGWDPTHPAERARAVSRSCRAQEAPEPRIHLLPQQQVEQVPGTWNLVLVGN